MLAELHLESTQFDSALGAAFHAEALAPEQPQIQLLKAHCLIASGETTDAILCLDALIATEQALLAKDWNKLGVLCHRVNRHQAALHCFLQANSQFPNYLEYRYNLATSLRNNGNLSRAQTLLSDIISQYPQHADAHLALSQLSSQHRQHLPKLDLALESSDLNPVSKSKLLFAKGKALEDNGEHSAAFECFDAANRLRQAQSRYQLQSDEVAMQAIIDAFPSCEQVPASVNTNREPTPIFITGLPRTGTTLVQQLLTNSNRVVSAGELHHFSACLTKQVQQRVSAPTDVTGFVQAAAQINSEQLGHNYCASLRPYQQKAHYVIDKLPLNFLYLGLIRRAMPQAKLIHLTRAPMAACFAMYKTSFEQAYPFSYCLNNLAGYYLAYRALLAHWQETLQDNLLLVNYETLVQAPEISLRRICDFLGLEYRPQMLDLTKNADAVATASSSQIRQSIHTRSMAQWQHYRPQLDSLYQALTRAGLSPEAWQI